MTPNTLAWAALYGWPAVVLVVFAARRSSRRLARTTAWMMVLPVMFLPANLDLPFASLNKQRLSMLSIAAALALFHRGETAANERWRHFPLFALIVFALGAVGTLATNGDPLTYGILRLPGLGPQDAAWLTYAFVVDLYIPFSIGQRVFRTDRDLRDLLEVLSSCALIYLPLCLIELRLSPQLSNWVYGYFPHSFLQTMRGSGYRPVVFMNHGLSVAMFLLSGFCAALALLRTRPAVQPSPWVRASLIASVMLVSRNLAANIYALGALALRLGAPKARAWTVLCLVLLVAAYPIVRAGDLIPTHDIVEAFSGISEERSGSLMFRFSEEDKLLEKAMQRPLFGWGNWARNRIFLSWGERGDEWAGYKDLSVTDGTWILWLGTSGFLGLSASYALLLVPLLRFVRRRPRMSPSSEVLIGALAVLVVLFSVDLIPNSQSDTLPVVYAGALFTLTAVRARSRAPARASSAGGEPPGRRRTDRVEYAHHSAGATEAPR